MAKKTTVLVLDDEENILNSIKRLFLNEPFGVVTTTDPDRAMRIIAKEEIKVVVSDYRMPSVSGIDFLQKVKKTYPGSIRIFFTGYADIQAAEKAVNICQVYQFIYKPWNDDKFKTVVYQAIRQFDLAEKNRSLFEVAKVKNGKLKMLNNNLKATYDFQEKALKEAESNLLDQRKILEQKKIALKEILGHIEAEKEKIQDNVLSNVNELLMPTLKKLRRRGSRIDGRYIDLLEKNLEHLTSSFGGRVSGEKWRLTPREIEICAMIRNGLTSKEIAGLLHTSPRTIDIHRYHIRKRLKISNKKINLVSHLQYF